MSWMLSLRPNLQLKILKSKNQARSTISCLWAATLKLMIFSGLDTVKWHSEYKSKEKKVFTPAIIVASGPARLKSRTAGASSSVMTAQFIFATSRTGLQNAEETSR